MSTDLRRCLARARLFPVLLVLAAVLPARAGTGPVVQAWTLDNGARVLFVEARDVPILDVAVEFRAGSGFDPSERSGLAAMTQHLARFGAGGLGDELDEWALAAIASKPAYFYHAADAEALKAIYEVIAVEIPCPADRYLGAR